MSISTAAGAGIPAGRLAATVAYLAAVTFGERAAAMRAAGRVRRIHDHVRGAGAVTGRRYAAGDPALLLWVHGALADSVLAAGDPVGTALAAADSNRYVAEMVTAAGLTGVPRRLVPSSVPGLDLSIASVRPRLALHAGGRRVGGLPARSAGPGRGHRGDLAGRPRRRDRGAAARGPAAVRLRRAPPLLAPGRRTGIRQSPGVLDALFPGQPGVLRARQRIALRMRAGQPA